MWAGSTKRQSSALAVMMSLWPMAVTAQDVTGADCTALIARMHSVGDYDLDAAAPVLVDGWCQVDGAVWRSKAEDAPTVSVKVLRLRAEGPQDGPIALEIAATGVKVAPKISDRTMDNRLRSFLRLQTADLSVRLAWNAEADVLEVRELVLTLPGRNRLVLGADIAGANLKAASSVLGGRLTALDVALTTDGRVARPVMEMAGERLLQGGEGDPVAAARTALAELAEALPQTALAGEGRFDLTSLIAGLPQTTGTLKLGLRSEAGIGSAAVVMLGLRNDPVDPKALAMLLGDGALTVDWQPGVGL